MDWRKIPSLSGLRAFEATARLNSFSAAGRELNVTHAAIAQHVRGLEDFFSQSLLYRQGRRMELTPSGQRLASSLSEGFLTIQGGVNDLQAEAEGRPLKIALTPSFAESWLMPRLGEFWAKHPNIKLTLLPSIGLTDLRRDGVDLAIRYGKGVWSGYQTELLASAQFVVVSTKEYIKDRKVYKLSDLADVKWLLESDRLDQTLWAEEQGLDLSKINAAEFPTATLAHLAARAGYGVAIVTQAVVERDLESGALVNLFTAESGTLGYYLVTRNDAQSKNLAAFINWLRTCKEKT